MGYNSYEDYRKGVEQGRTSETGQRLLAGIFGGPIGWYEAATGKNVVTNEAAKLLGDTPAYEEMNDEDVYNSMSPADWDSFGKMNDKERASFVAQRKKQIQPDIEAQKKRAEQEAKQAAFDDQRQKIIAKVQAFADEMNMPVDELLKRDDFAKALNQTVMAQASQQGSNRGFGVGGISAANADEATKRALIGYQMQRQTAGQDALSKAHYMLSGMAGEAENARRYEQGLDLQLQQANEAMRQRQYAEGLGQRQTMMGLIGTGVGAYFGGPTGAAIGGQLGSSIGGYTYGQYNPQAYKYPSAGGRNSPGYGGGSGIGGVKFGGNY